MNNKTKVIIGISLPVVVILFIVGSILFPKMFFHPKYDFVYSVDSSCPSYNCNYYYDSTYRGWIPYKVVDGKITKTPIPNNITVTTDYPTPPGTVTKVINPNVTYPTLYRYDVTTNVFKQISFEEAQGLILTDAGSDPDGTVVVNENNGGGGLVGEILGGGGREYGLYLRNGSLSRKIVVQNASQPDYYYNSNFHLVGWVK